ALKIENTRLVNIGIEFTEIPILEMTFVHFQHPRRIQVTSAHFNVCSTVIHLIELHLFTNMPQYLRILGRSLRRCKRNVPPVGHIKRQDSIRASQLNKVPPAFSIKSFLPYGIGALAVIYSDDVSL